MPARSVVVGVLAQPAPTTVTHTAAQANLQREDIPVKKPIMRSYRTVMVVHGIGLWPRATEVSRILAGKPRGEGEKADGDVPSNATVIR